MKKEQSYYIVGLDGKGRPTSWSTYYRYRRLYFCREYVNNGTQHVIELLRKK